MTQGRLEFGTERLPDPRANLFWILVDKNVVGGRQPSDLPSAYIHCRQRDAGCLEYTRARIPDHQGCMPHEIDEQVAWKVAEEMETGLPTYRLDSIKDPAATRIAVRAPDEGIHAFGLQGVENLQKVVSCSLLLTWHGVEKDERITA